MLQIGYVNIYLVCEEKARDMNTLQEHVSVTV